MKSRNNNRLINGIVILSTLAAILLYYFSSNNPVVNNQQWYQTAMFFPTAIDEQLAPTSLTYAKYTRARDSIAYIRDLRNGDNQRGGFTTFFNIIGTQETIFCDTCTMYPFTKYEDERFNQLHKKYFLTLPGWTIDYGNFHNSNFIDFYVKNKQPYLIRQNKNIPVKFVYSHYTKCIMIPVSKRAEKILFYIILSVGIAGAIFILYLCSCFLYFLIDISQGKVFTDKNLRRLRHLAIGTLCIPLTVLSGNLIVRLGFNSYFMGDVVFNWTAFDGLWKLVSIGILFLLIYKAFAKGKQLTEEQELTI